MLHLNENMTNTMLLEMRIFLEMRVECQTTSILDYPTHGWQVHLDKLMDATKSWCGDCIIYS